MQHISKLVTNLLLVSIFCFALPGFCAKAADFDPNFVISDAEATETQSFDAEGVQAFLEAQGSGLANYTAIDTDGASRRASDIIYNAAVRNKVSPRFLLALLQREQSLVTDPSPSQKQLDWATGFGVCDSCSMDDPSLAKYKGFATQVENAAADFRSFMDNGGQRAVGQATAIDGIPVTPETNATACLYDYTPHLNAQENFWLVWQRYFVRRYPSGTLATAAPAIAGTWLIRFGERRLIASPAVLFSSFDPNKVVKVAANDLLAYPVGQPIKFPDYSLLRSPHGTVYLIDGDMRRGIVSMDVFRKIGFDRNEVIDVTWDDLNAYKEGTPITLAAAYPLGALLMDPATHGVYFVQNGVKRPLYGPELLGMYFKGRKVKKSSAAELALFTPGDPINLADGELVKTADSSAIYVIDNGERLPIDSADTFEKQGWKWENVVVVSDRVLDLSPLGTPFDYQQSVTQIASN
jgi:hypothetical protein